MGIFRWMEGGDDGNYSNRRWDSWWKIIILVNWTTLLVLKQYVHLPSDDTLAACAKHNRRITNHGCFPLDAESG